MKANIEQFEKLQVGAHQGMGKADLGVFNEAEQAGEQVSIDNMPSDATFAKELPPGRYRFVEMPSDGKAYRVAAIRVDDNSNKATYIADPFINKEEAMIKLNQIKGTCGWDGADPSRLIHIETSKPQDAYENLD